MIKFYNYTVLGVNIEWVKKYVANFDWDTIEFNPMGHRFNTTYITTVNDIMFYKDECGQWMFAKKF